MRVELVTFLENGEAIVRTDDGRYYHLDDVKPPRQGNNKDHVFSGLITLDFNAPCSINPELDKKAEAYLDAVKTAKVV